MTQIDAATRMAYVDGELDDIARRRVERAMAADPALAEAVARDRVLRDRLQARFAPYAEEPPPDRFRSLLDTNVAPITQSRRLQRRTLAHRWVQGGAIAATLVLGIAIGRQIDAPGLIASRGGALVAHGRLESALDTQLAATQPNDAAIRMGLTFRDRQGSICRTFDSQVLQGIACRGRGRWDLIRTAGGNRGGDYRQASSGVTIGEAQQMMVGRPFSAAEEALAKQQDWE
ncbi:MAG: anti-sigma factor family protein [Sphingomonas sp.]